MLTVALAQRLLAAGVLWTPQQGDRFVLPGRGMDGEVFWLSDMTVEVHELPRGRVVGFNGTTEWAMDSVRLEDALWLPREDQLRALLGDRFAGLRRTASGWVVVLEGGGWAVHEDVECAYALAVLDVAAGRVVEDDVDAVVRLALRLHDPAAGRDEAFLRSVLHEDLVEHGPSGRVRTRDELLACLLTGPARVAAVHEVQAHRLSPDVVLVTSRSDAARRSSTWTRDGGAWRLRFAQETPL